MLCINQYGPNPWQIKTNEMQGELDKNINFISILNVPLSELKDQVNKKISKDIDELNNIINKLHLRGICRTTQRENRLVFGNVCLCMYHETNRKIHSLFGFLKMLIDFFSRDFTGNCFWP